MDCVPYMDGIDVIHHHGIRICASECGNEGGDEVRGGGGTFGFGNTFEVTVGVIG